MGQAGDAQADDALDRLQDAAGRASSPGAPAAVLAIAGVGGQIVAFLYGFQAATSSPPSLGWTRVAAIAGLLVCLGVLTLLARLVDEGWLASTPALAFLGFGAFVGGVVAFYLPTEVGGAGQLFLYTAVVLLYGTLVVGLLWLGAGLGYMSGRGWWRSLLAAPVLLHTGAHAVLFVGLLIQAGSLAEAAALVPVPGA